MNIWIDVETAAGLRLGDGPIDTVSGWESVRRLDAAGTFSFTMPASDPRLVCSDGTNLLAHKRVVRCWGVDKNGIKEIGAGIVDQIEVVLGGNATMLRVAGDDLLRELANRTVGDLELFQAVEYSTTSLKDPLIVREQGWTFGNDLTLPASIDLRPITGTTLDEQETFIYFEHPRAFSKITLTLSTLNTTLTDTVVVQYYNAQEPGKETWETLPGLVNNSAAPHPDDPASDWIIPFGVAGETTIEFDAPLGWSKLVTTGRPNGTYIIRMMDQVQDLTAFTLTAASVTVVEPVTDGLQRIMAMAPDGWSLDPAGEYLTVDPVYMHFAGESVLSALVMLAEQTGEHFTLSASGRRVWWLGAAKDDSGLRAAQADEPSGAVMAITALSRLMDSYDLCTRLYGFGGGVGSGRLSMATASNVDLPDNWAIDPDGLYLENEMATALYGRIDRREDFPDIAPVDASKTQIEHASNMLVQRIKQTLQRASQLQYAYRLEVAPGQYDVWPGQTIQVVYHEWVDGYHSVSIDATLWVLEITQRVTPAGVRVAGLTVATVDSHPANDYRTVARLIGSVRQERGTDLPASSFTSNKAGVPVTLGVRNGQITGIRRVNPVADRWLEISNVSQIKTTNGIITAVVLGSSTGGGGTILPPIFVPMPP